MITDFETRSKADLKKVGAWEYSLHPSTRILCVSWILGTRVEIELFLKSPKKFIHSWSPAFDPLPPRELILNLQNKAVTKVAHNAGFEQAITKNVLWPHYVDKPLNAL